jgi:chromosome segregation ATPase
MEEQARNEIAETEKRCHQLSLKELRKCEEMHLAEIDKLHKIIKQHDSEYETLKHQVSERENVRKKTETKLREVVAEFQNFIDLTKGFTKGQSEFLLPDVNLLQDMLKGAVSSCHK